MIIRQFDPEHDLGDLEKAIAEDQFHPGEWKTTHFTTDSTDKTVKFVNVVEDDRGPVGFVRYTKTLRVSCVWCDADNAMRNARALVLFFRDTVDQARANGFTEIVTQTKHPKLAKFLTRIIGMSEHGDQYFLGV